MGYQKWDGFVEVDKLPVERQMGLSSSHINIQLDPFASKLAKCIDENGVGSVEVNELPVERQMGLSSSHINIQLDPFVSKLEQC